ncbi:MAG TPA: SRPBCC family protein [Mycobacteriales bacterium]|nr:SRPBCC family protein [Mycobacteriales bacterium]
MTLEVSRDIAASPDAVYAAISDVARMGEWSEECHACQWRYRSVCADPAVARYR